MATKKTTKKAAKKAPAKKAAKKAPAKKAAKKAPAKKAVSAAKEAPKKDVQERTYTFDGNYHYAVGRRKAAVAQARIYERDAVKEDEMIVNDRKLAEYFPTERLRAHCTEPLRVSGMENKFAFSVFVKGGGPSGQADAAKLAIARALTKFDDGLRAVLKAEGLLTRDARKVERKKPGLRKARRSPQWSKR